MAKVNKSRIRIDQVLWTPDGTEVARFSVAGETLEQALTASQLLVAPHVCEGLAAQVVRVGYWCDKHRCYHDATAAISDQDDGPSDLSAAMSTAEAN